MLTIFVAADFETTYATEIALFTPAAPPVREASTTPSPTWPRSPPSTVGGIPHLSKPSISGMSAITGVEEAAVIRPVSIRQGRGARLSFLGGRKKELSKDGSPPLPTINGDVQEDSPKDSAASTKENRRSFISGFRTQTSASNDARPSLTVQTNGMDGAGFSISPGGITGGSHLTTATTTTNNDWVTDSAGGSFMGGLSGTATAVESPHGNGEKTPRESTNSSSTMGGSVRKRLSLLRLGKKSSKDNAKQQAGVVGLGGVDEE